MTAEPPEVPERGRRSSGLLGRLGGGLHAWQVGLVAGILVAGAVAGYLWLSDGASTSENADAPQPQAVEEGVACPHLHEAFIHSQAGDMEAVRRSVDAAAQASEQALQQSRQEFGRAEEIAIELQYALNERSGPARQETARYLTEAQDACDRLGRWVSTG